MYSDRIQVIDYKGKKIFFNDFSNLNPEEVIAMLGEFSLVQQKQPLGSMLYMASFENIRFNLSIINAFNKDAQTNSKYYKASALIGIKGLIKVMYDSVSKILKQDLKLFDKKEDALEWLAGK